MCTVQGLGCRFRDISLGSQYALVLGLRAFDPKAGEPVLFAYLDFRDMATMISLTDCSGALTTTSTIQWDSNCKD